MREVAGHFPPDLFFGRLIEGGQLQFSIHQNAAFHSGRFPVRGGLDRLEPKDQGRNHFVRLGRANRDRNYFIHRRPARFIDPVEIAGLHRLGQTTLRETGFVVRREFACLVVWWNQNSAVTVEKAVEPGVQRIGRVGLPGDCLFHQIAQFRPCAGVEKIERVIFQGSVNPCVLRERVGTIGDRRVAQILQPMERGQLEFEVALHVSPRVVRRAPLGKEDA